MIAVDLSKQQALDADPKAIQQINFTANLNTPGRPRIYFIFEEAKETVLEFSQGTVKVLQMQFYWWFNFYKYRMTQYNSLNVKLSKSHLNKLKSAIKIETIIKHKTILKYDW